MQQYKYDNILSAEVFSENPSSIKLRLTDNNGVVTDVSIQRPSNWSATDDIVEYTTQIGDKTINKTTVRESELDEVLQIIQQREFNSGFYLSNSYKSGFVFKHKEHFYICFPNGEPPTCYPITEDYLTRHFINNSSSIPNL